MSPSAPTAWLTDVFVTAFEQQERNKLYEALVTQATVLFFVLFMKFDDKKKTTDLSFQFNEAHKRNPQFQVKASSLQENTWILRKLR